MSEQEEKVDKAFHIINEIIGDFVVMSRNSPEEDNISDSLMELRNILEEILLED